MGRMRSGRRRSWTGVVLALAIWPAIWLSCGGVSAAATCVYDVRPDASAGFPDLALRLEIRCDAPLRPEDFHFGHGGDGYADWDRTAPLAVRVRLGERAGAGGRGDFAATPHGVLAPISAWLPAPRPAAGVDRLEIAIRPAAGVHASTNLRLSDGRLLLRRDDWRFAGYSAFADRPPLRARAPGPAAFAAPGRDGPATAEIAIAVLDEGFEMSDAAFAAWVERFSGLIARFWAGFPTDRLLIAIAPGGRPQNPFGRVRGGGGPTMMLRLWKPETPDFLHERDWVLTHELIHLAAPFAPARPPWFMEGMATYLEPLIRALGGARREDQVWAEWLRAMPTGAYGLATTGLDGGGHAYWTGALYFLLAHVELARRGDETGLARCFRSIRAELGDASERATVDDLIAVCDRALGAPVLATLHQRRAGPADIDLPALWRELGISAKDEAIGYAETGRDLRRTIFGVRQFTNSQP